LHSDPIVGADELRLFNLGALARRLLAELPELNRLRLSSLDPSEIDDELWWLLADEPRPVGPVDGWVPRGEHGECGRPPSLRFRHVEVGAGVDLRLHLQCRRRAELAHGLVLHRLGPGSRVATNRRL
jgi:hypothetical protein